MALVLCTGVDVALLQTRKLILEQAGHKVVSAMTEPEVVAACRLHPIDVAIVGQTVPAREKPRVLGLVREHCPKAKILELHPANQPRVLKTADDWLAVPTDAPPALAECVAALANEKKR